MSNENKQPKPKYTLEFKQDAAKLVLKNGYTRQRAADHLGVSLSAISRWVKAEKGPEEKAIKNHSVLNLSAHDELIHLRKENEQLRMEREILKKGRSLLCERSRIRYAFIREQQKTYPVTTLCRVMKVSTSAYYAWANNPDRQNKTKEEAELKEKIKQIFYDNKQVYGSRRMSDALNKIGLKAGRYKVVRLMAELGLKVRYPKKFKVTTDSDHNDAISPNKLEHVWNAFVSIAEAIKQMTTFYYERV